MLISKKVRRKFYFFNFISLIFLFSLVSATPSIINCDIPNSNPACRTSVEASIFINESEFHVNSSDYWGNYYYLDYDMPGIKLYAYNQTATKYFYNMSVGYVPYIGASQDLVMGVNNIYLKNLIANFSKMFILGGIENQGYNFGTGSVNAIDLNTGLDYCNSLKLKKGWNAISFIINQSNMSYGKDINISIVQGINYIGYSSPISISTRKIKLINGTTVYNNALQYVSINLTTSYGVVGISADYLRPYNNYYVYSTKAGILTFEGVGGSSVGEVNDYNNLRFSNGTDEKSNSQSATLNWIGDVYYWNESENGYESAGTYDDYISGWRGYWIKSNIDNLYLIIDNSSCKGKTYGSQGYFDSLVVAGVNITGGSSSTFNSSYMLTNGSNAETNINLKNVNTTKVESTNFTGNGAVPVGGIIMWSGNMTDVYYNLGNCWKICNGSDGTPDLRNRFVVGANADSGGVAKTNITSGYTQSGGSVNHTHSTYIGAHNHFFELPYGGGVEDTMVSDQYDAFGYTDEEDLGTKTSGNPSTVPVPYYALAYIKRVC